jgi:hypothetical protein
MYKISAIVWAIGVLLFTTSSGFSIAEDETETGEVQLTADQYGAVYDGKNDSVLVVQTSEHEYSGLKEDLDRISFAPVSRCDDLFKTFLDKYLDIFQSLANKNCRVYFIIWSCPYGGYRFFVVKPYRLCKWEDPIYKPKIPVWEWPQVEAEIPVEEIARG